MLPGYTLFPSSQISAVISFAWNLPGGRIYAMAISKYYKSGAGFADCNDLREVMENMNIQIKAYPKF